MTRAELHQMLITRADRFGVLVQFRHPLEEPDDRWSDPKELRLLRKLREWADEPEQHPAFGQTLSEKIRRRARSRKLPLLGAHLVASGRQLERMQCPSVRLWQGAALDNLAVLAQSSENVWMRDKEPQLERIAGGRTHAVTLLLPTGFADPRLSPPLTEDQP